MNTKNYKGMKETGNAIQYSLKCKKSNFNIVTVTSSNIANDYARKFYKDDISIYESSFIILLNNANNTIGFVKISQGGLTHCVIDSKIIAKYAIEALATAVIVVHNHPTGNSAPSRQDERLTKQIKETMDIIDVRFLDHIIVTPNGEYYSFADNGKI